MRLRGSATSRRKRRSPTQSAGLGSRNRQAERPGGSPAGNLIEIRFPKGSERVLGHDLNEPLESGGERVCIGLLGSFTTDFGSVLSVSALRSIPDSEYRLARGGTAWSSTFTAGVLSEAMARRTGVLMIHSHGFSEAPTLSPTDERSFSEMLLRLRALLPDHAHGSVVVGRGLAVGGSVVLPGEWNRQRSVDRVRWVDDPIRVLPPPPRSFQTRGERFDRQELVIGQHGQAILNASVLGVVGLGGGGSHIVQQAAHAGFGTLVLVDHDTVETTNMSRLAGAIGLDVGRSKTEVFSALARRIRPESKVRVVTERFPSESGIRELKSVDVVVSCVDTLTARVELQKFSWRYLVPLIDIGIGTRLKVEDGPRRAESIAGHVHVYLPGGPCMWCTGLLSQEKLTEESGGKGPEYVEGAVNPGQVVSFNGVVASMALTEAIQLVTGFIARKDAEFFRTYDAATGDLYSLRPKNGGQCPHGGDELGLGAPTGYSMHIGSGKHLP